MSDLNWQLAIGMMSGFAIGAFAQWWISHPDVLVLVFLSMPLAFIIGHSLLYGVDQTTTAEQSS